MVKGLDGFQAFFKGFTDSFVLMGGVACEEWFSEAKLPFRVTKNVGILLPVRLKNPAFFEKFWEYLRIGEYSTWEQDLSEERDKNGELVKDRKIFLRFYKPKNSSYPEIIELLSLLRKELIVPKGKALVPLAVNEEVSSLSATLHSQEYYQFALDCCVLSASGLPLVNPGALLLLKIKTYLNLVRNRYEGNFIKGVDIKRHRNDVFRLSYLLKGHFETPLTPPFQRDLEEFLTIFSEGSPEWQGIMRALIDSHLPNSTPSMLLERIRNFFSLPQA